MILKGDKEYFKDIPAIKYEGPKSDNPLAFKYYNPDQIVAGKTMREHFKFAVAYWHTFCGQGADPFGIGTQNFLGIKLTTRFKGLLIKQMLLLNLLPKWVLIIIVFTTMI